MTPRPNGKGYKTPFWTPNWERRPESYLQGVFVRLALEERGRTGQIRMDHMNGRNMVDDQLMGVVYPDSWFAMTAQFVQAEKSDRFFFQGFMPPPRAELLACFKLRHPDATIISSGAARKRQRPRSRLVGWREVWDEGYYESLGRSEFGLCPHHPDWPGPWGTMWTYRFAECCMVGAIPVLFRATPLSAGFVDGFRYVWDDDATFTYDPADAKHNRALAEERFRLP